MNGYGATQGSKGAQSSRSLVEMSVSIVVPRDRIGNYILVDAHYSFFPMKQQLAPRTQMIRLYGSSTQCGGLKPGFGLRQSSVLGPTHP